MAAIAGEENKPDVSLSAIDQLPQDDAVNASQDSVKIFDEQIPPTPAVGQSFTGLVIESDQQNENIDPAESALGSFIRKLPK